MIAQCSANDYYDASHSRGNRDGRASSAAGPTDIRCEIFRGQLRALLREALPNETHGAGPTCFSRWYQPHHESLSFPLSFSLPLLPVSFYPPVRFAALPSSVPRSCTRSPRTLGPPGLSLSPFLRSVLATACSPDTPPGSPATTYVSFCGGLAVHGEGRVPLSRLLSLRAVTLFRTKLSRRLREGAAPRKRMWVVCDSHARLANSAPLPEQGSR